MSWLESQLESLAWSLDSRRNMFSTTVHVISHKINPYGAVVDRCRYHVVTSQSIS